jgi:hypothetical protein
MAKQTITIKTIIAVVGIVLTIGGLAATAIWAISDRNHFLHDTSDKVAAHDARIAKVEDSDANQNTKIAVIETKQTAILDGIEDIKGTQKVILERLP